MFWLARVIFALVGLAGLWSLRLYSAVAQEREMVPTTHGQH